MKKRGVITRIIILVALLLLALLLWRLLGPAYQAYRQQQGAMLQEKILYYGQERREYEDFLISTQLPSGAYATHPYEQGHSVRINPYFACYTAIGLMDSQGQDAAGSVRQYLDWHFAHLNVQDYNGLPGTIYDYSMTANGTGAARELSHESYDSTDAYAALFLWALADYVDLTGDAAYALSHTDEIIRVSQVIFATQSDGLSFARPDYPVFFLMDNCEVYYGLLRANALINTVFAEASPAQRSSLRECQLEVAALLDILPARMEEAFWNAAEKHYWPSLQQNDAGGFRSGGYDPDLFYPDAVSQLFPIAVPGLLPEADRDERLYQMFCDSFSWQTLAHMKDRGVDFYWGLCAYGAALQGDEAKLNAYLDAVNRDMPFRPNALYSADAAWIARACAHMESVHQKALDNINFFSFISEQVLPGLFSR